MKILCPVDSAAEAARLMDCAAAELYGGILPKEWEERFTLAASANRRSFSEAQLAGEEALREVIGAVHGRGGRFFLTVNSPFYTKEQLELLLEMTDRALEAGVDALIAADIGLLSEAGKRWPGVPVHLSAMAEVSNAAAVSFYRGLGVSRVTLPRHLGLRELEALVKGSPGVTFDVFVLYGQCVNAEGLCTFSHDHPERVWPCVQPYGITGRGKGTGERAGDRAPALCGQMLWAGLERGEACGLCALWDLRRLGIEGLKIVGRGTSSRRKEWAVRTVAELVDMIEGGAAREDFRAEARRRYGERFPKGCRPMLCYFPELMTDGQG